MSSTYSSFAVAGGSGGLGALITSSLVGQGTKVAVLSRSTTTAVPTGASVRAVDYSDEDSIVAALEGIEVVVSALSDGGFGFQKALANAAKRAGVWLFVPSEFGNRTNDLPAYSLIVFKKDLQEYLRSIDLPYTLYFTGWFTDFTAVPPFGFDIATKRIEIIGSGNVPISWTARPDIAHFVAYTLTHLSTEKLANAALAVEGEKLTLNESVASFKQAFGGEWTVTYVPAKEVEEKVKEQGAKAFLDYIRLTAEQGLVDVGKNDNALVPDWKPLTLAEGLKKYLA